MATRDWMKSEYPAHGRSARLQPAETRKRAYSPLELGLIGASVLAWGWCLYEVALLVLK